jgi:hypothetical protein
VLAIAQVQVPIVRPSKRQGIQDVAGQLFSFVTRGSRRIEQGLMSTLVCDAAQQCFACMRSVFRY